MPENPSLPLPKRKDVTTIDHIKFLKKGKWKYFSIVLLSGFISFCLLKFVFLEYSATVSFYVNDHGLFSYSSDFRGIQSQPSSDNFSRIYELINSAQTNQYLIKKFDLVHHYKIDTTSEFYYQKAVAVIASKIKVTKNPFNTISVTVSDKYRYLTADIANEIAVYLDQINREYYTGSLNKNLEVTESYIKQLQIDNSKKSAQIDSLIVHINSVMASGKLNERMSFELLSQQAKLGQLVTLFQSSTENLINYQQLYSYSVQALNYKNYPTITVLKTAMPAFRSLIFTAAFLSILVMILCTFVIIFISYIYLRYKDYMRFILTDEKKYTER